MPPGRPERGCLARAGSMSVAEQASQLPMVAVDSTGVTSGQARVLRSVRPGAVILLGNSSEGVAATRRVVNWVRDTTGTPDGVETLLAVDQEGGAVQRLRGRGFSDIPSARRQGELTDAELRRRTAGWAAELADVGIDADLAPVADVVPVEDRSSNAPIGVLRRDYGADPETVAAKVAAVVHGLDDSGLASAAKHFPGLGRVRGNTDVTADVADRRTRRDDPLLRPFAAAVAAGADMVMLSSASYPRIAPKARAAYSPVVVKGMLRGDLGFSGVVVSDDLAAVALRDLPPGERAIRFLAAGGDLAIVGDAALAPAMHRAIRRRAADDPEFAAELRDKSARVLDLKQRRGLADC